MAFRAGYASRTRGTNKVLFRMARLCHFEQWRYVVDTDALLPLPREDINGRNARVGGLSGHAGGARSGRPC